MKIYFSFIVLSTLVFQLCSGQTISFESYYYPESDKSFSNYRILSFQQGYSGIYLGYSLMGYSGDTKLKYDHPSILESGIHLISSSGNLTTESKEHFFGSGREYFEYRTEALTNSQSIGFIANPSNDLMNIDEMTFSYPCSYIGIVKADHNSESINYLLDQNCVKFDHFYGSLVTSNEAYCLYSESDEFRLKSWTLNPFSELSTIQMDNFQSIPYIDKFEETISYISEKQVSSNNTLSGKVKTVDLSGNELLTVPFQTAISNPRLVKYENSIYLIEPYEKNFSIEKFDNNGNLVATTNLPQKFSSIRVLSSGSLVILTEDRDNHEQPNMVYLLDDDLNEIGSIVFGVPYSTPISAEIINDEILYIAGVVKTSHLLDNDFRRRNLAMLVKLSLDDLANSIRIKQKNEVHLELK